MSARRIPVSRALALWLPAAVLAGAIGQRLLHRVRGQGGAGAVLAIALHLRRRYVLKTAL